MKTRTKNRTPKTRENREIAIVGLSLRFPKSDSLDEFWSHLMAERSLITEIPANRWRKEDFYGDPRSEANKTDSVWGGFIDDADCFDASFFNISPREAMFMDPQQRLTMELAWKAIEDAGYPASSLKGTKTGVFMGVCNTDYTEMIEKYVPEVDAYIPTGVSYAIIANRISYWFDFTGPSLTIDTACAGSLSAIHQAVRALENNDCEYALAGGVNLCWSPRRFIALSRGGMLSKEGKSKTFDADADGYVRAEGGAILVLKPLARAVADADRIYAVIKGVGTNHGGRTNSLTITNPKAQADLIAEVYEKADIPPDTVSYIETHGPGTPLGDPIEIHGLKTAFKKLAKKHGKTLAPETCGLGSVKTNIGHLEAAAGIAGIIKVVAAMKYKTLPACVHFHQLNPVINFTESPFYVVDRTKAWEIGDNLRRAGVSSFGFGGCNAHIILEEYIPPMGLESTGTERNTADGSVLVPLSAKTKVRLRESALRLAGFLKEMSSDDSSSPGQDLVNIAYTLQTGREAMEERVIFTVTELPALISALESYGQEKEVTIFYREGRVGPNPPVLPARSEQTPALISPEEAPEFAAAWVQGASIEWGIFYRGAAPARIGLPTYPFAKERYWMPVSEPKPPAGTEFYPAKDAIHPLLQQNTSDLSEQRYRSLFTGEEFFLADYRVGERKVLPETACLEMARVAVAEAAGSLMENDSIILKNIVWGTPIALTNGEIQVHTAVYPEAEGVVAWEIYSGDDMTESDPVVHCQGNAIFQPGTKPPVVDLEALRRGTDSPCPGNDCYMYYENHEIQYGPGYRGLKAFYPGNGLSLAELVIPQVISGSLGQFVLHPSIMESAIQALSLLLAGGGRRDGGNSFTTFIPFGLKEITIFNSCRESMWAVISSREVHDPATGVREFDIDFCDGRGEVTARLKGLLYQEGMGLSMEFVAVEAGTAASDATDSWIPDKPQGILLRPLDCVPHTFGTKDSSTDVVTSSAHSFELTEQVKPLLHVNGPVVSLEALQQELSNSLAEVLYITDGEVDIDKKFIDLGLDSIIGVEWIRVVNKKYSTTVAATKVYDYPTIREFAVYLEAQIQKQQVGTGTVPHTPTAADATAPPATVTVQPAMTDKPRGILLRPLSGGSDHPVKPSVSNRCQDPLSFRDLPTVTVTMSRPQADLIHPGVSLETLQQELAKSLAEVLYITDGEVDIDRKFIDLGLDSIIGVEWVRTINKKYGTSIVATKVYDYPTIREFAVFLEKQLDHPVADRVSPSVHETRELTFDDILQEVAQGTLEVEMADQLLRQIFEAINVLT